MAVLNNRSVYILLKPYFGKGKTGKGISMTERDAEIGEVEKVIKAALKKWREQRKKPQAA